MQILIHYSKRGNQCWTANTDDQLDVALAMLFQKLNAEGYYTRVPGAFYENFISARQGDIRQIKAILAMRNGREGESWEILRVTETRDYTLVSAFDQCRQDATIDKGFRCQLSRTAREAMPEPANLEYSEMLRQRGPISTGTFTTLDSCTDTD